jgi:hypothetical protein
MEREKNYYSEDLIKGAIEDLQERIKWCEKEKEDYDIDALIQEVADNNIPIYTYDLLQYASNNFDLIYKNELCSKDADCIQIITMNIYEMLTEHLYNHINNKVEVKTKGE